MKKYEYDITILAPSEKEADLKAAALKVMGEKLSANELSKLADVITNDPIKLQIAKKALGV
ncbi:MAG: hypothetical protein IT233_12595 [Bacteroidia bacterium]|nr:hypothetical protein [Bacteroidia bacterium]